MPGGRSLLSVKAGSATVASARQSDDSAGLPALDGGFNDELGGQGVGAGAVDLVGAGAGQVLLDPAADAAGERLVEAHHAAEVIEALGLAGEARVELQVLAR